MTGWISSDCPPKNTDIVICLFSAKKKGTYNITFGWYDGIWRCGMKVNVTHWLPRDALPAMPPLKSVE